MPRLALCACALLLCLPLAPARADSPPPLPALGTLRQVEVKGSHTYSAKRSGPAVKPEAFGDENQLELTYVERVDKVEGGRVTQVTRHYVRARRIDKDVDPGEDPSSPLDLEGRQVVLKWTKKGVVTTWNTGAKVREGSQVPLHLSPSPWLDGVFKPGKGDLKGVNPDRAGKRVKAMPACLRRLVKDFPLKVKAGAWSASVTKAQRQLAISLQGSETRAEKGEGKVTYTMQVKASFSVTLGASKLTKLPSAKAPPQD